jgi:ketosteroid isomerase-like protein
MKKFNLLRNALRIALLASIICVTGHSAVADESKDVTSTVDAFHDALQRGDGAAAMKLLGPDVIIQEGGGIETRSEYESHHLNADMAFAKAVPSTRSNVRVQVNGDTAWLTSASRTEGTFNEKPINSRGVELIVLTKTADGWRIRAIHWSSQKVTKTE